MPRTNDPAAHSHLQCHECLSSPCLEDCPCAGWSALARERATLLSAYRYLLELASDPYDTEPRLVSRMWTGDAQAIDAEVLREAKHLGWSEPTPKK